MLFGRGTKTSDKSIITCLMIALLLAISSTADGGPTIFGVDSASQQLLAFDPWRGMEIRRMDLPGSITAGHTDIGLAGSQSYELYYVNASDTYVVRYPDILEVDVYVLDTLTGSVNRTLDIVFDWEWAMFPNGLGYESGYLFVSGCGYMDLHRYDATTGAGPDVGWGQPGADFVMDAVGGDYGRVFVYENVPGQVDICEVYPLDTDSYRVMETSLTNIVGMAYDGTYLYASTRDNMVCVLDPDTANVLNQTQMDYTLYALGAAPCNSRSKCDLPGQHWCRPGQLAPETQDAVSYHPRSCYLVPRDNVTQKRRETLQLTTQPLQSNGLTNLVYI